MAITVSAGAGITIAFSRSRLTEAFQVAGVAAWLPPFLFLLFKDSPWALAVAALIGASVARLMCSHSEEPLWEPPQQMFCNSGEPLWTPRLAASLFASMCFLAAALLAADWPGLAHISLASGSAAIAWHWTPKRNRLTLWRTPVAATVLLLALHPAAFRGGGSGRESAPEMELPAVGQRAGSAEEAEVHSGIILWPEEQPHIRLVPPLPAMRPNLFAESQRDPLSVPFYGVYWLFRPPHKKPPPNSFTMRGDPARASFRSTGGRPLIMEARQNFGRLIRADCCSGIQLAIRNGDRHPGTIKVELILVNTAQQAASRSLGAVEVKSTPRWQIHDNRPAITEILDFPMTPDIGSSRELANNGDRCERCSWPAGGPRHSLFAFDEVVIRFHLGFIRARYSPKVAIDRFVFVPAV